MHSDFSKYSKLVLGKDTERVTLNIRDDDFVANYAGNTRVSREKYPIGMLDSHVLGYISSGFAMMDMELKH